MKTIIVEIPDQLPPNAWVADSDLDIIVRADVDHGLVHKKWTLDEAIDCYGDKDEIPEDLAQALAKHEEVIEIGDSADTEYYSIDEAESELESAKTAIAQDLPSCHFLTIDEAKTFVEEYDGRRSIETAIAVKKALENV